MGFEITSIPFEGYNLNIWDVGGQQTLRSFWFNYFDQLDALIWVIDVSQLDRLAEVFRELYAVIQNERVYGVKLLILLNKIDLVNTDVDEVGSRVVKELELKSYGAQGEKWGVMKCSAITGEGIQQGLRWITGS
jgi:ADP-ribosylation factor-like protein 2